MIIAQASSYVDRSINTLINSLNSNSQLARNETMHLINSPIVSKLQCIVYIMHQDYISN